VSNYQAIKSFNLSHLFPFQDISFLSAQNNDLFSQSCREKLFFSKLYFITCAFNNCTYRVSSYISFLVLFALFFQEWNYDFIYWWHFQKVEYRRTSLSAVFLTARCSKKFSQMCLFCADSLFAINYCWTFLLQTTRLSCTCVSLIRGGQLFFDRGP